MDLPDDDVTDVFGDGADTLVDGGGEDGRGEDGGVEDGGRGIRGPRYGSGVENAVENGSDEAESSPLGKDLAPATADDVSDRMDDTPSRTLPRRDRDARGDGGGEDGSFVLGGDVLAVAMGVLERTLDLESGERFMEWALGEEGGGRARGL